MNREERIIEMAKIIQGGELKGQRNGTKITYNTDVIVAYGMQRLFGAEALDNAGYRKEQDLLKEFVEYVRENFIEQTAYGCDCVQHSGYYDYKIKIGDVIDELDQDLEKFLEERK